MIVTKTTFDGKIAHLEVGKSSLLQLGKPRLEDMLQKLKKRDVRACIIDMSRAGSLSYNNLGTLIELFASLERDRLANRPGMTAAICGLSIQSEQRLSRHGLGDLLPIFPTYAIALRHDMFRGLQIAGARAVLLCAAKTARMTPLIQETPVPMLDFLGQPILTRRLDHLSSFGVTDYVLNIGHLGAQIRSCLRTRNGCSKFYVDDIGIPTNTNLPMTLLARLSLLSKQHSIFEDDTFVILGNALSDIDLNEMMTFHKSRQADVTIAALGEETVRTGVMVLGPATQTILNQWDWQTSKDDLGQWFRNHGAKVQTYVSEHLWLPIRSGSEYYSAHQAVLQSPVNMKQFPPVGFRKDGNIWVEPTAKLGRNIKADGCSYIGAKATVASGAMLTGNCVVGERCRIEKKTLMNNSLLLAGTLVGKGTIVDHMIASPSWAIHHKFADGRLQNKAPISGIRAVSKENDAVIEISKKVAGIA